MNGKGDTPRPLSVDRETFGENWDRVFNPKYTMEDARSLGVGLYDIKRCMKEWPTDDPMLAAYFANAQGCALLVKGGPEARDKWDREYALRRYNERLTQDGFI